MKVFSSRIDEDNNDDSNEYPEKQGIEFLRQKKESPTSQQTLVKKIEDFLPMETEKTIRFHGESTARQLIETEKQSSATNREFVELNTLISPLEQSKNIPHSSSRFLTKVDESYQQIELQKYQEATSSISEITEQRNSSKSLPQIETLKGQSIKESSTSPKSLRESEKQNLADIQLIPIRQSSEEVGLGGITSGVENKCINTNSYMNPGQKEILSALAFPSSRINVDINTKRNSNKIILSNSEWKEKFIQLGRGQKVSTEEGSKKRSGSGSQKEQKKGSAAASSGISMNFFKMLGKMKAYAYKMASKVESKRFSILKRQRFEFLRDKSISDLSERESNILSGDLTPFQNYLYSLISRFLLLSCVKSLSEYTKKIPLFRPQSKKKFFWDILNTIIAIGFFFFMPLHEIYDITFEDVFYFKSSGVIGSIILTLDMFVSLNTSKFIKGHLQRNRTQIFVEYISSEGLIDLCAVASAWVVVFQAKESESVSIHWNFGSLFILSIFMKILSFHSIQNRIDDRLYLNKTKRGIIELIQIIFNLFIVSHLFACAWLVVGKFGQKIFEEKYLSCDGSKANTSSYGSCSFTWLDKFQDDSLSVQEEYLRSYYFVTITMITVGYGDIIPLNSYEYLFSIFTMLIACGMFGYSLNSIGQILAEINKEKKTYSEHFCAINGYMHQKNIPVDLQFEVKEYLQYFFMKSKIEDSQMSQKVIQLLPEQLKKSVIYEANKIIFEKSKIFKNNFSNAILDKTIGIIEQKRIRPGEEILSQKVVDDCAFYLIEKGKVELYNRGSSETIKILEKGESFGEIAFFTNMKRHLSARSIEFTSLLMIKRQAFLELIQNSPLDYEKFSMIKDSILILNQFEAIGTACYCCNSTSHSLVDCNFIHQIPDQFKVIHEYSKKQIQSREPFKRIGQRLNSLENIGPIAACSFLYVEDNIDFLQGELWFTELLNNEAQTALLNRRKNSKFFLQNYFLPSESSITMNDASQMQTPTNRSRAEIKKQLNNYYNFQQNKNNQNVKSVFSTSPKVKGDYEILDQYAPMNFSSACNDIPSPRRQFTKNPSLSQTQLSNQALQLITSSKTEEISGNIQQQNSSTQRRHKQSLTKNEEEVTMLDINLSSKQVPQLSQGQSASAISSNAAMMRKQSSEVLQQVGSPQITSNNQSFNHTNSSHNENNNSKRIRAINRVPSVSIPSHAQTQMNYSQKRRGTYQNQHSSLSNQSHGNTLDHNHLQNQQVPNAPRHSSFVSQQNRDQKRRITLKSDYQRQIRSRMSVSVASIHHLSATEKTNDHLMKQIQDLIQLPNQKQLEGDDAFETMKNFSLYFPQNNYEKVLVNFKICMMKKMSKKGKSSPLKSLHTMAVTNKNRNQFSSILQSTNVIFKI